MGIQQECDAAGVNIKTYYYRRSKGMSKEEALGIAAVPKSACSDKTEKAEFTIGGRTFTVIAEKSKTDCPPCVMAVFEKDGDFVAKYGEPVSRETVLKIIKFLGREINSLMEGVVNGHKQSGV